MRTPLKLVVGGGRAGPRRVWDAVTAAWFEVEGMPLHGADVVTLNIDPGAQPDMIGDVARMPFRGGAFREVYFEHVPWAAFTGGNLVAIDESARVLLPNGRIVIETGGGVKPSLPVLRERMAALGFRNVRVTFRRDGSVRVSARLGGRR
jgi:hypothetical protein